MCFMKNIEENSIQKTRDPLWVESKRIPWTVTEESPQPYSRLSSDDESKLEQENGKLPEKEGMLPRKISESGQFSYVLDNDGRRWQILLLLWVSYPYSYLTECTSPCRGLHFPFNYTRSMKASLSQWDIKSNLLLDFGQVSPPLYILKRDKRRKRKERGRDAPLPAFDMYAILGAAAAILKPWGLKPKKKNQHGEAGRAEIWKAPESPMAL